MGRIADALARATAEQSEFDWSSDADRGRGPSRWVGWYGSAPESEPQAESEVAAQASRAPLKAGMAEELVAYYDRSSMVSEQYRSLRTRLLSINPHNEHRSYVITSAIPKEGKSVTTINLGFCFSEVNHLRTLMIDADLRHSSLAGLLNCDNAPGFADLLIDEADLDDVIRPMPAPNLFFIPAGRTQGRSAAQLFSTQRARSVFARIHQEFHYTFIDTPPATTVADVSILGPMTSGLIFVVRMHRTPEPLARRAIKHLTQNNIPIVGGVVVGDNDPAGGYGYQYSYYKYYSRETA